MFHTNKSVLLYGSETWREGDINSMKSIQVFVNKCLRNILGIRWLDTISNSNLWRKTIKQQPVETTIGTYRWNWLGHTLRKPNTNTTRQALKWNPQGHWKRGRPKNTWHRVLTSDLENLGRRETYCKRQKKMESHCSRPMSPMGRSGLSQVSQGCIMSHWVADWLFRWWSKAANNVSGMEITEANNVEME